MAPRDSSLRGAKSNADFVATGRWVTTRITSTPSTGLQTSQATQRRPPSHPFFADGVDLGRRSDNRSGVGTLSPTGCAIKIGRREEHQLRSVAVLTVFVAVISRTPDTAGIQNVSFNSFAVGLGQICTQMCAGSSWFVGTQGDPYPASLCKGRRARHPQFDQLLDE